MKKKDQFDITKNLSMDSQAGYSTVFWLVLCMSLSSSLLTFHHFMRKSAFFHFFFVSLRRFSGTHTSMIKV